MITRLLEYTLIGYEDLAILLMVQKSCTCWYSYKILVNNGISITNLNWWVYWISEPSTVGLCCHAGCRLSPKVSGARLSQHRRLQCATSTYGARREMWSGAVPHAVKEYLSCHPHGLSRIIWGFVQIIYRSQLRIYSYILQKDKTYIIIPGFVYCTDCTLYKAVLYLCYLGREVLQQQMLEECHMGDE